MNHNDYLHKILDSHKANRREFMVAAIGAGVSAATASTMWSSRANASTPKKGGHLRCGLSDSNTVDSLDPATYTGTGMIVVSRAIRDSLVEIGQDNTAAPALAESWEANKNATEWRFNLRKGVEFSNGKSLTTDDVIDSINVHRGEDSTSGAKGVFSGISNVSSDGPTTVVIELSGPNANFPFLMTDYHMNIVPSLGEGKADVTSKVGTGVFILKEFVPGVRSTFERNPNAWQQDTAGYVDSAEVLAILDDNARQTALMTNAVDVINRPSFKTIEQLKKVPGVNVIAVPSNLAFTHPMRMNVAPFDNNDFRQALKHALPRQQFVDIILSGYGEIGNDQPLGPLFESYNPDIKNEYDLDKAKYFLNKAGMKNAKIDMSTSDTAYTGAEDAAVLFADSFRKAGIETNVIREPKDGYWSDVWNKKPFCSCYWGARPIEDMILSICYVSDAPWNDSVINIPRVDELVVAARGELDKSLQKEMYSEVQMLISKQGGTLIPAFSQDVAAVSDRVGIGPKIGGGWELDGGFLLKRWWLES